MARRLQVIGVEKYPRGFDIADHPSTIHESLTSQKPRIVFVDSMSDLFHQSVSAEFIKAVFGVMNQAPRHTFQVLTKRPAKMA